MKLFTPAIETKHKLLLINEPNSNFLCTYCKHRGNCSEYNYYNYFGDGILLSLQDYDNNFVYKILSMISANNDILKGVLFAVSEPTLVQFRKELYSLSKQIFEHNKTLSQFLFTNVEFNDLLNLKSSYKYLTYVDYIMQNKSPNITEFKDYIDCLFTGASYIDLAKSFSFGKPVYTNL